MDWPVSFERMWAELAPLGRSTSHRRLLPASRSPRSSASSAAWFPSRPPPATSTSRPTATATWSRGGDPSTGASEPTGVVLTGSHLDSVLDGGAYDGPLGVVSSLAAIDLLRERGVDRPRRSGSRCSSRRRARGSGSPAWVHDWPPARPTPEAAKELRDRDGVTPARRDGAGRSRRRGSGRAAWVDRIDCFVELHVEQGRDLVDRGAPVGRGQRRSGRTGATASTSPATPTTPAPPGWRTVTTRCSATP